MSNYVNLHHMYKVFFVFGKSSRCDLSGSQSYEVFYDSILFLGQ